MVSGTCRVKTPSVGGPVSRPEIRSRKPIASKQGPEEPSDEELLARCARREQRGLEELTRRYQAQIYGFLLRLTGSPEDAEEATLEVFLKAWLHADRFQYRARVSTWLFRIAVNIARDLHSRKRARPQEPWPEDEESAAAISTGSAEDDALASLQAGERAKELRSALAKLSASDRELIVLYYFNDADYDEIQEVTGLSYTVLKTRLARARQRLRQHLERAQTGGSP